MVVANAWDQDIVSSAVKAAAVLECTDTELRSVLKVTFDGDNCSCVLALDNYAAEKQAELAPHKNILDLNEPRKLSEAMTIPKPVSATIGAHIHRGRQARQLDPRRLAKMAALPDA